MTSSAQVRPVQFEPGGQGHQPASKLGDSSRVSRYASRIEALEPNNPLAARRGQAADTIDGDAVGVVVAAPPPHTLVPAFEVRRSSQRSMRRTPWVEEGALVEEERRVYLQLRSTNNPELAFDAIAKSGVRPRPELGDMVRLSGIFQAVKVSDIVRNPT